MVIKIDDLQINEIIALFKSLTIKVTDDEKLINQKGDPLKQVYHRMKRGPDPQKRNKADEWFAGFSFLQQNLSAVINKVIQHFMKHADTILSIAITAGKTSIDQEIYDQLLNYALEECYCDPRLARKITDQYLDKKGFRIDSDIIFPTLVTSFIAVSSPGCIEIEWNLPKNDCDEIILKRFNNHVDMKNDRNGLQLIRGRLDHYYDRDEKIQPGSEYYYKVYSVLKNYVSKTGVPGKVIAVSEVYDPQCLWDNDHIKMKWENPAKGCEIYIFRSSRKSDAVSHNTSLPISSTPSLKEVFHGKASEWDDHKVSPGEKYYYLIIAFFAPGYYSYGIIVSLQTPIPPQAVSTGSAYYTGKAVKLHWKAVRSRNPVSYIVRRTIGGVTHLASNEGERLTETKQTSFTDRTVVNGRLYTYAIFSCRDGVPGIKGFVTKPVAILHEIHNLVIKTGDGSVTICWKKPMEAKDVHVCRYKDGKTKKIRIPHAGPDMVVDTGLENGKEYYYLITCLYAINNRIFTSPGKEEVIIPAGLPGRIIDFNVKREGRNVLCHYRKEGPGIVVVVRSNTKVLFADNALINADELDKIGPRLPVSKAGQLIDTSPTPAEPYYTSFIVTGNQARYGSCRECVVCDDVSGLALSTGVEGIRLEWRWPAGCKSVLIKRRKNCFPEGIDDDEASAYLYTLTQYENNFNSFLDPVQSPGEYFYIIYAQPYKAPKKVYSPGNSPGCRDSIIFARMYRLSYSLTIKRKPLGSRGILLEWEFDEIPEYFSGFQLVANSDSGTFKPGEGIRLFKWIPDKEEEITKKRFKKYVPLEVHILKKLDNPFFCRLFYIKPEEKKWIQIFHPDMQLKY